METDYIELGESGHDETPALPPPNEVSRATQHGKKRKRSPDPQTKPKSPPPWLKSETLADASLEISKLLHSEIRAFVDFVNPTPEEHQMRRWVVKSVERVARFLWPQAEVLVFGSFDTGLYLPTSDLDLVVVVDKENIKKCLYRLGSFLKSEGVCTECQIIARARVPIIKFVERITGFNVDICFNTQTGVQSGEIIRKLMDSEPAIRPLVLVLKQFLAQRAMNEVYTGGLGSYAATILVASFLQMHPLVQSGRIKPEDNLGVLLIEMFELYGRRFNYEQVGISIRKHGSYFRKASRGWFNHQRPNLLAAEDPQDESNDVAKSSFGVPQIRQAFVGAFDILTAKCYEVSRERARSADFSPPSILGAIVDIPPDVVEQRERVAEQYFMRSFQRAYGESFARNEPQSGDQ